jgi:hypothetical protein
MAIISCSTSYSTPGGGWSLNIQKVENVPISGNTLHFSYKPSGSYPSKTEVTFKYKYVKDINANYTVFNDGTLWIKDYSDKIVELGGKGGLRVVDVEDGTENVPCAQYSAYKINFGIANTDKDALGGVNITNTHSIICYDTMWGLTNNTDWANGLHFVGYVNFENSV